MIKWKEHKLLELTLVVTLDIGTLLDNTSAVKYLVVEVLGGINAELHVVGGSGGHKDDLCTEFSFKAGLVGGDGDRILGNGGDRELLAIRDDCSDGILGDDALECLVGELSVHKQGSVACDEDRPEDLYPLKRVRHIKAYDRALLDIGELIFKGGGDGKDTLLHLAVCDFLDTVSVRGFRKNIIGFVKHLVEEILKALLEGSELFDLIFYVFVDSGEAVNVGESHM